MQLEAVCYSHTGQQTVPLAYELDVLSIPSGPDELLGYRFLLDLTFSDLHGGSVSDFMVTVSLNRRSDGNITILEDETRLMSS